MSGNQGRLGLDHNAHPRRDRGVTIDGAELTLLAMQQAYTLTEYLLASDDSGTPGFTRLVSSRPRIPPK